MTEGTKYDQGKNRLDLLPFVGILEVGKVATFGATKYSDHNWKKGMAWSRLFGACLRHLCAWVTGQSNDTETGLPHLAHAAWCLLALTEYEQLKVGVDDRFKRPQSIVSTGAIENQQPANSISPVRGLLDWSPATPKRDRNEPHELGLEPIY